MGVNDLVEKLEGLSWVIAYADDVVLMFKGKFLSLVRGLTQGTSTS